MRTCFLVLSIFGLLCVPASADSTPHWWQVHTEHFTVITDSNEKQARHIAGQFERMQFVFNRLVPSAHADTGSPIVVLALKDRRGFQSLEPPAYLGKGKLELAGYFMPAMDKSYIVLRLDSEGDNPFSTVYHEYTHYILRHVDIMPLWLNEGLAEFYQNTTISEKEVLLGKPSGDDILYLRQQRLLPLPALFAVDHNSPYYHDEEKGSIFYSESWALTHYLEIADFTDKTSRLQNYVVNLSHHQDPLVAAQNAFGDLKKLQSQLDAYIENGDYKMFKMPTGVTIDEASFKVDPLATSDADALRADVLVDNQRTTDAQALLDNVLKADPGNALAHESEGMLCFRQHDLPCARKWYGEAVALHSTSYLAYYYYAVLSLQHGDGTPASVEDSLKQSLKLNPSFAPANDALARFYGMHHENLDQALILSVTAITLEPDNLGYRFNNSQLHMERQEIVSALGVLAAARRYAKTPDEQAEIDIRTERIKQYQAQLDSIKRPHAQAENPTIVTTTVALEGAHTASTAETPPEAATEIPAKTPAEIPDNDPHFPAGPPAGPHHTVRGVLHDVHCAYPTILTLTVEGSGKQVALYSNNMYKVVYSATNFSPAKGLQPCREFEGMKASVTYTKVSDERVAGQIISIVVSK